MNEPALRALLDAVDAGAPAALITVAATRGSTPTEVGARLLVRADGAIVGTIGGGRLEAKAIGVALGMLASVPGRHADSPGAADRLSSASNLHAHNPGASGPTSPFPIVPPAVQGRNSYSNDDSHAPPPTDEAATSRSTPAPVDSQEPISGSNQDSHATPPTDEANTSRSLAAPVDGQAPIAWSNNDSHAPPPTVEADASRSLAAPVDRQAPIAWASTDSHAPPPTDEANPSRSLADPWPTTVEADAPARDNPRRAPSPPDDSPDDLAPGRRRRPPSRVIASLYTWNLQRDVGMTCGGEVTILVEAHLTRPWRVVLFGAGHVAQALAPLLLTLDVSLRVIDPRPDWLSRLPASANPTRVEDPDEAVAAAPPDAAVVLMTQGHRTDLPVLERLLRRGTHPFIGVIGSRAKATVLRQELTAAGLPDARFTCPVGLDLGRDEPAEIAISIAAQLLQVRDAAR